MHELAHAAIVDPNAGRVTALLPNGNHPEGKETMKWLMALVTASSPAFAGDLVSYDTAQSFDDVIFGLESAIIDAGLVVDHVSRPGEMLERTRGDVGSDVVLFDDADVYSFCSASLSREVMEADPLNIMF
mgnify:FL=1